MEQLLARHGKEERDLQSRIAQKKKAATKKTRKAINDECEHLERDLKQRHDSELAALEAADHDMAEGRQPNGASTSSADEPAGDTLDPPLHDGDAPAVPAQNHDRDVEAAAAALAALPLDGAGSGAATPRARRPNRQKARLARRAAEREELARQAAEEAESLPNPKEREREAMSHQFQSRGLKEKEIRADGHCLYAAVADGLSQSSVLMPPGRTTGL